MEISVKDYRELYGSLNAEVDRFKKFVANAEKALQDTINSTKSEFDKALKQKREDDKRWFVDNLAYILKYKDFIAKSRKFGEIIIDFLPIYQATGLVMHSGFYFCCKKITLKKLLQLWDNGFKYNDCPILGYEHEKVSGETMTIDGRTWGIKGRNSLNITYYKNGQIHTDSDTSMFYPLPEQIISQIREADVSHLYPDWQEYPTIDVLKMLRHKGINDEMV